MKTTLTWLIFICIFGSVKATSGPNELMGKFLKWADPEHKKAKETEEMTKNTFDLVVPAEEEKNWRELLGKFGVAKDDNGCWREWIPKKENKYNYTEMLLVSFENQQKQKDKKKYQNIDELIAELKEEANKSDASYRASEKNERDFQKINNKEAIIESVYGDGDLKSVAKVILYGDWLISLEYRYLQYRDKKKNIDWKQAHDYWLHRFQQIHFE